MHESISQLVHHSALLDVKDGTVFVYIRASMTAYCNTDVSSTLESHKTDGNS